MKTSDMRALHLCFFPESDPGLLLKAAKVAAASGYTHVIVEFWGTLKYDCLDVLGWKNAYPKDAVRPIFDCLRERGVEPIPMFNMLGHAAQASVRHGKHVVLDQRPELEDMFEKYGWTWCCSSDRVKKLLTAAADELIELCGDGEYFHIGCDEAYDLGTCPKCAGTPRDELFTEQVNFFAAELKKRGRRAIIWGDMLIPKHLKEAGYTSNYAGDAVKGLSRDIVVADWQYHAQTAPFESTKYLVGQGFDVVVCPWYESGNIAAAAATARECGAGFMLTTWNRLESDFCTIVQGAEALKGGGADRVFAMLMTAKLLREIDPSGGGYDKAGWGHFRTV